jgi:hypothetical protein
MTSIFLLLAAQATAPVSPPDRDVPRPLRLGLVSTSAFGMSHARFFNQLVGGRLEYRFDSHFAFGGALSYANLEGKDERAHNVLPEATSAYRVGLDARTFALPLRLSLGYLPKNGPTLRVSAGLELAFSDALSLELVPLEAMLWVTRERPEFSLDASAALLVAF